MESFGSGEDRKEPVDAWPGRHPGTRYFLPLFGFSHLPAGKIRDTSELCHDLASDVVADLPDGPELSAGLRKLLEAKDCFVRAAVLESRSE